MLCVASEPRTVMWCMSLLVFQMCEVKLVLGALMRIMVLYVLDMIIYYKKHVQCIYQMINGVLSATQQQKSCIITDGH